ncbi:unnamed protein product [Ectocarpus sp. 12 AP-2014]
MGSSGSKQTEPPGATPSSSQTLVPVSGTAKPPKVGKSGKKICCSCPDTKAARDDCVIMNGEEECKNFIEAHKECLRSEGFDIR